MNITKIIAAVVVLIGLFALKFQPVAGIFAIAAGIVLLAIPKKVANEQWDMLVKSFEKKLLLIALFDALYFAVAASASWFFGFLLKDIVLEKLKSIAIDKSIISNSELAQASVAQGKQVFASFGITVTLYILTIIILYAVSRTFIWALLTKKKASFDLMKRFFSFTIAWFAIFIIPIWIFYRGLKEDYFVIGTLILFLLYGHLTAIAQYSFIQTGKIKESIITAFRKGILELKQFIVPYAYLLIILLITTKVLVILPERAATAGTMIYFILYLAWYRCYITQVFRRKLFKQKHQK